MKLFQRSVRVIVSTTTETKVTKTFRVRTQFKVEKNDGFFSNKASVTLYNLNDDSKKFLENKKLTVRLDAGYDNQFPMLFFGDVSKVDNGMGSGDSGKGDILTVIEAGDGERALTDQHIDLSLGPRSTNREAFNRILNFLNITTATMKEFREIIYTKGYQFCGPARKAINDIMREVGYTWSIQNGVIQAMSERDHIGEIAVVVQRETGLLDFPKKGTSSSGYSSGEDYDWKFESMLNAEIAPGRLVKLNSPVATNVLLRVSKVEYEGDSEEGDYKLTAEGFLAAPK